MAKLARLSRTYLIADARERAVIPFIETEFQEHAFTVKQVTTADYIICRSEAAGAVVLAAIERKSHADFSASFKDGRHDNIAKMTALRAATGCTLMYFVEGPAFLSATTKVGGIPFGNIIAAMTKMMVCDGIFVVQTESEAHTAKRLLDFVRAFDAAPVPAPLQPSTGIEQCPVPDVLTARAEETDDEAAVLVWARLDGISVTTAKIITRAFSVAELASQSVTVDRIRALRSETGRSIGKDAVESLLHVRSEASAGPHGPDGPYGPHGPHRPRDPVSVKLVSGIKNITPAIATQLIDAMGGLAGLCESPCLAEVMINQTARSVKFGKPRADRVQRVLRYVNGS
jgi:ERCC4-type nuclease